MNNLLYFLFCISPCHWHNRTIMFCPYILMTIYQIICVVLTHFIIMELLSHDNLEASIEGCLPIASIIWLKLSKWITLKGMKEYWIVLDLASLSRVSLFALSVLLFGFALIYLVLEIYTSHGPFLLCNVWLFGNNLLSFFWYSPATSI